MVTIIKNQLLKHLSRYTKNLSPEQISLSALRGSGELADLTLDEELLTELLELPAWLRLTSAKCNRAAFRIQWTKLKTVPIALNLDEVHIALEVCNEPRPPSSGGAASLPQMGKYSFVHKVIDGISVAVNSVQIHFSCDAFNSSVQIMRVLVESRTPQWQRGDLTLTRIKSPDTGHLLIFKELEWQSARVEATSHTAADSLPPIRLLVGPSHTRIVLKKRLSDAQVIGCRLVIQAEPMSLAFTDGQLSAAAACAAALAPPIKAAADAARKHAATRKLQQSVSPSLPEETKIGSGGGAEREALRRLFNRHDVKETSYHLLASRIDMHLCDDPGLGRSEKPSLGNGGALQVSLHKLQADYFPFHLANGDRRHWRGYREAATPHSQWLSQSVHQFRSEILELFDPRKSTPQSYKPKASDNNHARRESLSLNGNQTQQPADVNINNNNENSTSGTTERAKILHQLSKLMTTCFVLRIDDFTVYKVCTGSRGREPPKPLISAETTTMPGDAGILHAEMTYFYYPGEDCFPVPPPKLYAQLSPVRVNVDVDTLVWLGSFFPHVAKSLDVLADMQIGDNGDNEKSSKLPDLRNLFYLDVKCEAIMPKIVLEAGSEHVSQQRDRPRELHLCTARATLTNIRELDSIDSIGSRSDLAETIAAIHRTAPSLGHFPNYTPEINERFMDHARGLDDIGRGTSITPELLWRENRSIWNARAEPMWVETVGTRPNSSRPTPLVDATPASAWLCADSTFTNIWVLARLSSLASVQINHYQLLFLLRQLEKLSEMAAWLAHDGKRFKGEDDGKISVKAVIPQAEVSVILPSQQNGQTDLQTDAESVRPDTSSLNDLKLANSDITVAPNNQSLDSGAFVFPSNIEEQHYTPAPPSPSFSHHFGGFSSMRRGFTSLVSSIDGALSSRDEVTSLASSDDDHFVVMGLADTPDEYDQAFRDFECGRAVEAVEIAAEVVEEQSSSDSVRSVSSSGLRRDLVSICTLRLNGIQLAHESRAGRTSLAIVSDDLQVSECPFIPWDEFQSKFSMRSRGWCDPTLANDSVRTVPHKIAARLERKEIVPPLCCPSQGLCSFEELLEARVRDLSIELHVTTALALGEFFQDEVAAPPLPIKVELSDVHLTMSEDRPSRDISAQPEPLVIQLDNLKLTRDIKGIISILPSQAIVAGDAATPTPVYNAASALEAELKLARDDVSRLERENEMLRRRLAENAKQMQAVREESSLLKSVAHAAQQDTAALLTDKHALIDTVKSLQDQLSNTFLGRGGKR